MKKLLSIIIAAALLSLPSFVPAYETEYTAEMFRALGETVFTAPDPGDTTIADKPVADYWPGWSTDETYANVNYTRYNIFGDYVVQFYKAEKGTTLTADQSFFENAQNNSGLGRLIAPEGGLGTGSDFTLIDFNFKVGDTGTCYNDYYFRDADGKLILAVRFDINGMYAATSADDIASVGALLKKDVSAAQPFTVAAWNKDGSHSVSLEHDGDCVFTKTLDGEINGFGSLDVVIGYYNAEYTHTGIGGLKITSGFLGGDSELDAIYDAVDVPGSDNVRGHITLPTKLLGADIEWTSSDENIVTADGKVTRGDSDKTVTLTAKITKNGLEREKIFTLNVIKKPEQKEMVGYIYAYFRGSVNGEREVQQIHLAISDDGLNWRDLNGNFPVIETTMGTGGIRDPYIIRSYEGDRFYLMATDLDSNGGQWTQYGEHGSQYLMFWESDDLVNWSEQRMIRVSDDRMGCTWAPEAIYDEENQEYLIYWASYRADLGNRKVIQCARTRDFRTFTEPEVFMGTEYPSIIDTTMVRGDDGKYYRFTKDEAPISVFMEVADKLEGPYTRVNSNIESILGVEGPGIFRMIDGRYCLMLDGYAKENTGVGFFPLVTDDIASGQFERLTSGYKMPTGAKHGVMITITQEEYAAVMDKWGPLPVSPAGSTPEFSYTFENDGKDSDGTLRGSAKIENGVLTLDGTNGGYFSLPSGIFDRRDTFTVSMDVLVNTANQYFFTFGVGNDTNDYLFVRTRPDNIRAALTITSNNHEEAVDKSTPVDMSRGWHNIVLVGEPNKLSLYLDGELLGETAVTKTMYHLGSGLEVNLGKSTWSDPYFAGSYDNVKIYYRALSAEEISGADQNGYSVNIENNKAVFRAMTPARAIIAGFDAEGGLTSVEIRDFSGTFEIDLPEAHTVKAFLWNDNLQPFVPTAMMEAED